jgi:hypothetical protein
LLGRKAEAVPGARIRSPPATSATLPDPWSGGRGRPIIDLDHIDRPSDEPITETGGWMKRMTMHRRIAAALAAALMFAAAAPAADARWFNFNGNGSLVLVTPKSWMSGHGTPGRPAAVSRSLAWYGGAHAIGRDELQTRLVSRGRLIL